MIKYVIALEGSERLKGFKRQKYASDFIVWPAFNGRLEVAPSYVDKLGMNASLGREASGGEIGCSVSHYELCKNFIQNHPGEEIMLVAEDDARFLPKIENTISRLVRLVNWDHTGIVVLANPGLQAGERNFSSVPQKGAALSLLSLPCGWAGRYPFLVGNFEGFALGTGLYLITQDAARRYVNLVENGTSISWVADHYHVWAKLAGIRMKIVRPGLCSWEGESTIGGIGHDWDDTASHKVHEGPKNISYYRELLSIKQRLNRFLKSVRQAKQDVAYFRENRGF